MRLGIDAREIQKGIYTGIGRPLANYLRYFAKQNNAHRCVLFSQEPIPLDFGPRVTNVVIKSSQTIVWDQWALPKAIRQQSIDVFYSPYYKIPLLSSCVMVSAILDLMYLIFPSYRKSLSWGAQLYYHSVARWMAHRSHQILTCSQYSLQDIKRLYGVSDEKIKVIPLSVGDVYHPPHHPDEVAQAKQRWGISGRYFLYMGNFKVHKNVSRIIEAFALVAHKFNDLTLVLAGPKEFTYEALVQQAQQAGLSSRIRFLGKIMESDQPHLLYAGAHGFVMPTLYEGFGLPPAEAMACATAVIASNATSVPEVVKDAGILINPHDAQALAQAMELLLTNEDLRQDYIRRGLQYVRAYESTTVAQMMDEFLIEVDQRFNHMNKRRH